MSYTTQNMLLYLRDEKHLTDYDIAKETGLNKENIKKIREGITSGSKTRGVLEAFFERKGYSMIENKYVPTVVNGTYSFSMDLLHEMYDKYVERAKEVDRLRNSGASSENLSRTSSLLLEMARLQEAIEPFGFAMARFTTGRGILVEYGIVPLEKKHE